MTPPDPAAPMTHNSNQSVTEPGSAASDLQAFLRSLPGDPAGHDWREVSGFAGRFCGRCDVDEDDEADPRRERCDA